MIQTEFQLSNCLKYQAVSYEIFKQMFVTFNI